MDTAYQTPDVARYVTDTPSMHPLTFWQVWLKDKRIMHDRYALDRDGKRVIAHLSFLFLFKQCLFVIIKC